MFRGTYTALVTPFRNGAVDEAAYEKLIEWQIENGVSGLVPVGTTGESPTLSHEEHERVISEVVQAARGRIKAVHFDPAIDWSEYAIVDHRDIPGHNAVKLIESDQPVLAASVANWAGR